MNRDKPKLPSLKDSSDELASRDNERLDWWLDAARNADLSEFERGSVSGQSASGQSVSGQSVSGQSASGQSASGQSASGQQRTAQSQRRAAHIQQLSDVISAASAQRTRGVSRRLWVFAAAAGLALVTGALALGMWSARDTGAVAVASEAEGETASLRQVFGKVIATQADGKNRVIGPDTHVHRGDEISTTAEAFASLEAGAARVDLSSATTLQLEELEPETQVFRLNAGRVDVSVPKVPGRNRLVKVTTENAIVTVHGTVFSVEVRHEDRKPITTVGVTRGLVSVDLAGERVMLGAGESWNSRDGRSAEQVPPPVNPVAEASVELTEETVVPRARVVRRVPAAPASVQASKASASDLAEQNRLFGQALRARDQGDDAAAIAHLRQLLGEYPGSPLRTTAQAELGSAKKRLEAE